MAFAIRDGTGSNPGPLDFGILSMAFWCLLNQALVNMALLKRTVLNQAFLRQALLKQALLKQTPQTPRSQMKSISDPWWNTTLFLYLANTHMENIENR